MGKFLDALKNIGAKVNGKTPTSNTTVAVLNEIANDYQGGQGGSGALYLYGIWDGEVENLESHIYSSQLLDIFEEIPSIRYGFSEATQEELGKVFNFFKSMANYEGNIYSLGVDNNHFTNINYDNSTETITIDFYYNGSLVRSSTLTKSNDTYTFSGDLYIDIAQV